MKKIRIHGLVDGRDVAAMGAYVGGTGLALSVPDSTTTYQGVHRSGTGIIADCAFYVQEAVTISDLTTYVSVNGSNGTFTVTIFDNGSASSVVTTYTTGQTGVKSDTANSFSLAAGEYFAVQLKNTGSFSSPLTFQSWSLKLAVA